METDHIVDFAQAFEVIPPNSNRKGLTLGNKNTPSTHVKTALFGAYLHYCDLNGIEPLNRTAFRRAFRQALATLGNEYEYSERASNGDYRTNVAYRNLDHSLKEWQG